MTAALLFASCGGGDPKADGGPSGGQTTVPGSGDGVLIYSRPDAIIEFEIESGETREIVKARLATSFLLDPAVSHDGTQLAYVVQPPAQIVDGRYDAGTDLWVSARHGSGQRPVFRHTQPNALVRYPRWTPDGDIIAIVQEIEETPEITRVAYTVQRFDVATGERTKLLQDAYAIAISPDGARLAYARPLTAGGESFESIALDGSGEATVIVSPDENLLPFNSPQYAPDGSSIAFASADQANAPPTPVLGMRRASVWMGARMEDGGWRMDGAGDAVGERFEQGGHVGPPLRRDSLAVDGLPQDVWVVDAGGGRPRLLASMQEDLPSLTWSGDGAQVYLLGTTGLYEIDVASGAVTRIGEGVFHGQIAWAP